MTDSPSSNLTPETPPETAGKRPPVVNWVNVAEHARTHPGEWFRLHHTFSTPGSARSSVQRAARKYGLAYQVTVESPQDDGRIGVFIKFEGGNE